MMWIKMVNMTALNNPPKFEFNSSLTNTSVESIQSTVIANFAFWHFSITLAMFISFAIWLHKDENIRFDINRSIMWSSLFVIVISYFIVRSGWSDSLVPTGTYFVFFIISLVVSSYQKRRE